ncbi:deoxycytidylate deaminase [Vibrio sinaloensis]|uniref:deoxycytidylate deaminase n=1 Tax=Photobacterium sp. (strain ATCC 43367) TaxID=379097 RepID=UPI0022AEB550|nr:deoxycytidylate deaminase [Vibrio sinaloensis]MCZ4293549.1 deoxycytidylate deaminase [Vibrio sinaloensis]
MKNKNEYLASALEKLHSKNEDFIMIGLTGRTGSGCTTAASILSSDKDAIEHSLFKAEVAKDNPQRKERILNQFYEKNWQPFTHLRVSSVLTLMLLDVGNIKPVEAFLKKQESIRKADLDFLLTSHSTLISNKASMSKNDFYIKYLSGLTEQIREKLEEASFVKLYQLLGKNARRSGNVTDSAMSNGAFFSIAQKINEISDLLHTENKGEGKSTYIAVDAIRSPLEASYFQERYSSFYLLAISCTEDIRKNRLLKKGLSSESIEQIDKNEYSSLDLNNEQSFTDQDIQGCLQRADIYIDSSDDKEESVEKSLANQLIKFVCLAQKPGLITPSPAERCMQVAYTSKLNSGCLSRQVGAVVTNQNYSIKAVGWNDAPYGQVPCNLRSIEEVTAKKDLIAYSPFELKDSEFQERIGIKAAKFKAIESKGYNHSYCFKSEYNAIKGDRNQVHTRSLHAEENAFLQVSKDGGSGVNGGFLFTTASPCELCAKKAYQLGMTKVFYIDPYPGISMDHILTSGVEKQRPEMVLFNGAIGRAFHNLYTPIAPYKDELSALIP